MAQQSPLFVYFRSFQTNIDTILLQIKVKKFKSIQYMAPGFEPTTSRTRDVSHNYYTGAPAHYFKKSCTLIIANAF